MEGTEFVTAQSLLFESIQPARDVDRVLPEGDRVAHRSSNCVLPLVCSRSEREPVLQPRRNFHLERWSEGGGQASGSTTWRRTTHALFPPVGCPHSLAYASPLVLSVISPLCSLLTSIESP